jgi:hypothetical protein
MVNLPPMSTTPVVNNLNNIRLPTPSKKHIVKRLATFPSPAGMSLSPGGNNYSRPIHEKTESKKSCDTFPFDESNTTYVHETFTQLFNKPTKYEIRPSQPGKYTLL